MRRKNKSLLGSPRSRFFREAKSRPVKFRPQNVRFRKRYATSILSDWGSRLWNTVKIFLVVACLGFAGVQVRSFWLNSSWIKISEIQFVRNPPEDLPHFLSLKPGQNIFKFRASELEKAGLSKFKELKSLSIHRHFSRRVSIGLDYRKPLAWMDQSGKKVGADQDGIVFPLSEAMLVEKSPPELVGFSSGVEFSSVMSALSTIYHEMPDFYSRIKLIKTDRILPLRIVIDNGVVVYWGEFNEGSVVGRIKKVLQVLNQYEPKKSFASIRFVTDDRLVMDSQWQEKNRNTKGENLGKT